MGRRPLNVKRGGGDGGESVLPGTSIEADGGPPLGRSSERPRESCRSGRDGRGPLDDGAGAGTATEGGPDEAGGCVGGGVRFGIMEEGGDVAL